MVKGPERVGKQILLTGRNNLGTPTHLSSSDFEDVDQLHRQARFDETLLSSLSVKGRQGQDSSDAAMQRRPGTVRQSPCDRDRHVVVKTAKTNGRFDVDNAVG